MRCVPRTTHYQIEDSHGDSVNIVYREERVCKTIVPTLGGSIPQCTRTDIALSTMLFGFGTKTNHNFTSREDDPDDR